MICRKSLKKKKLKIKDGRKLQRSFKMRGGVGEVYAAIINEDKDTNKKKMIVVDARDYQKNGYNAFISIPNVTSLDFNLSNGGIIFKLSKINDYDPEHLVFYLLDSTTSKNFCKLESIGVKRDTYSVTILSNDKNELQLFADAINFMQNRDSTDKLNSAIVKRETFKDSTREHMRIKNQIDAYNKTRENKIGPLVLKAATLAESKVNFEKALMINDVDVNKIALAHKLSTAAVELGNAATGMVPLSNPSDDEVDAALDAATFSKHVASPEDLALAKIKAKSFKTKSQTQQAQKVLQALQAQKAPQTLFESG